MKALVVVPVRAQSSGLRSKNFQQLRGRPLWRWAVETALHSRASRVVVSSDAPAEAFGEFVSIDRLLILEQPGASDTSLPEDAERYVLVELDRRGYRPDVLVRMFCTTPFTSVDDVNACLAMIEGGIPAVVSVTQPSEWPSQLVRLGKHHRVSHVAQDWQQPRQAWSDLRIVNGGVYAATLDYYEEHRGFFGPDTRAYEMPQSRSVDIDTAADLDFADRLAVMFQPYRHIGAEEATP